MIVHDKEIDHDWHSIFAKQARDKALKAKFAFTKNPEIVQVCTYVCEQYVMHNLLAYLIKLGIFFENSFINNCTKG